jgi:hypothetical protein
MPVAAILAANAALATGHPPAPAARTVVPAITARPHTCWTFAPSPPWSTCWIPVGQLGGVLGAGLRTLTDRSWRVPKGAAKGSAPSVRDVPDRHDKEIESIGD